MLHAESVCLLKHRHNTPWSPAIGRATSPIRYWDLRIKCGGIRDKNDALLDYYYDLSGVGAEFDISITVRECIHQINNARSKLKDGVNNATELRTQFEVNLAMEVVEHKRPEFCSGEIFMECDKDVLVQKELTSKENRRTAKRSWQKLGRHRKANSLQLKSQGRSTGLGQGLIQKNRLKHSLLIATSNNYCTQVTLPLVIQHWEMSWDTQVTH
jgi:hypothetical protein